MAELRHLLIRGVNWLGDAIMSLAALQRLREAHPHAQFTMLTRKKLAGLWEGHPLLDGVLTIAEGESLWTTGRRLREREIDTALILPNSPRAALEAWLAFIPQRIGYAARWRRVLLTQALLPPPGYVPMRKRSSAEIRRRLQHLVPEPEPSPGAHHIHHYLHLAEALGADPEPIAPQLFIPLGEMDDLKNKFKLPSAQPLLAIIPGAEYGPAKRWPPDRFAAAARVIHTMHQAHILVLGSLCDQPITAAVAQNLAPGTFTDLTLRTSLRELAIVLAASHCVLTNDTGPMHLAAAVDTPVVALFGSTHPQFTAPGLPGNPKIQILRAPPPCAPCFLRECPIDLRCLRDIQVDVVVRAVSRFFEQK